MGNHIFEIEPKLDLRISEKSGRSPRHAISACTCGSLQFTKKPGGKSTNHKVNPAQNGSRGAARRARAAGIRRPLASCPEHTILGPDKNFLHLITQAN